MDTTTEQLIKQDAEIVRLRHVLKMIVIDLTKAIEIDWNPQDNSPSMDYMCNAKFIAEHALNKAEQSPESDTEQARR